MGALHELELYTGTSCNSWGGHVDTLCVSRRWRWHSNRLKLEVVALSVGAFLPTCTASLTYNTEAEFYVNKRGEGVGVRSKPLSVRTEELLL